MSYINPTIACVGNFKGHSSREFTNIQNKDILLLMYSIIEETYSRIDIEINRSISWWRVSKKTKSQWRSNYYLQH